MLWIHLLADETKGAHKSARTVGGIGQTASFMPHRKVLVSTPDPNFVPRPRPRPRPRPLRGQAWFSMGLGALALLLGIGYLIGGTGEVLAGVPAWLFGCFWLLFGSAWILMGLSQRRRDRRTGLDAGAAPEE